MSSATSFFQLGLQYAEQLPRAVREELEQLVAALQKQSQRTIPILNIPVSDIRIDASQIISGILARVRGGTGIDTSGATNGQLLIGRTGLSFQLHTLTGVGSVSITNGSGTISISASSYVPLALGSEPLTFVSDGAGVPILISYAE